MIGIDRRLCGLEKHVMLSDGKASFSVERLVGDWVGTTQNHADPGCMLTLFELEGKKHAKNLTAEEKALAVNAILTKDGARAEGDFARTKDGLANQQKILTAEWTNASAALGSKLLPMATKAVSAISGFITGMPLDSPTQ